MIRRALLVVWLHALVHLPLVDATSSIAAFL
jgi:hypothetical protein